MKPIKAWAVILGDGKKMDEPFTIYLEREWAVDECLTSWDGKVVRVIISFPQPKRKKK